MSDARTAIRASVVRLSIRRDRPLSADELASATGITVATLHRLVRAGILEADAGADGFSARAAERLDHMLRLHEDVGVNLTGAAIILDLLERLDAALGRR